MAAIAIMKTIQIIEIKAKEQKILQENLLTSMPGAYLRMTAPNKNTEAAKDDEEKM